MLSIPFCKHVKNFVKENKQLLLGFSLLSVMFVNILVFLLLLPLFYLHIFKLLAAHTNYSNGEERKEHYWSYLLVTIFQCIILLCGFGLANLVDIFDSFFGTIFGLLIIYVAIYFSLLVHGSFAYSYNRNVKLIEAITNGAKIYSAYGEDKRKTIIIIFSLVYLALSLLAPVISSYLALFIAFFFTFALTAATFYLVRHQDKPEEETTETSPEECPCTFQAKDLLDPQTYITLLVVVCKLVADTIAGIFQAVYAVLGDLKVSLYQQREQAKSFEEVAAADLDNEKDKAETVIDKVENVAEQAAEKAQDIAEKVKDKVEDLAEEVSEKLEDLTNKSTKENTSNTAKENTQKENTEDKDLTDEEKNVGTSNEYVNPFAKPEDQDKK